MKKHIKTFLFLGIFALQNTLLWAAPAPNDLDKITQGLCDLKYLGSLSSEEAGASTFYLSMARACKGANTEKALFLHRADGKWSTHFVPPGKILDPKTRKVVFDSRAFFGKCLSGKGDVYVSFQKEPVGKRNKINSSVFIGSFQKNSFQETLLEKRFPRLQDTLSRVKKKLCTEIETRNRTALNKPLDLNPRVNTDEDEDDDENDKDKEKCDKPEEPAEKPNAAQ